MRQYGGGDGERWELALVHAGSRELWDIPAETGTAGTRAEDIDLLDGY